MSYFDSKLFNGEVFQQYVDRIPNLKLNELIKSRAITSRPDLASVLKDQTGGNYITTPLKGLISGTPLNYDGETNITATSTKTFSHSRVVVGRAKAWTEKDFSFDITGGVDFMENVAQQVAEYWQDVDQATLIHIINGVFNMTDTEGAKFVDSHTSDISGNSGEGAYMNATTLNSAIQKACGDNKNKFSLVIMHSSVATNLENLKILVYLKYNDANGMERDAAMATLNGKLVLIDDGMPTTTVDATYSKTSDTEVDSSKTYYTRSGSASAGYTYTAVASPEASGLSNYYEMTSEGYTTYTTYIFGDGAIEYTNCGAKVPSEMARDAKTNGGQDTLYSRQRKCFAPYGISFVGINNLESLSPTDDELETGENWELVNSGGADKEYINIKAIPIARIISRG